MMPCSYIYFSRSTHSLAHFSCNGCDVRNFYLQILLLIAKLNYSHDEHRHTHTYLCTVMSFCLIAHANIKTNMWEELKLFIRTFFSISLHPTNSQFFYFLVCAAHLEWKRDKKIRKNVIIEANIPHSQMNNKHMRDEHKHGR